MFQYQVTVVVFSERAVFEAAGFVKLRLSAEKRFVTARELFHAIDFRFRYRILFYVLKHEIVIGQGSQDLAAGIAGRQIINGIHKVNLGKEKPKKRECYFILRYLSTSA